MIYLITDRHLLTGWQAQLELITQAAQLGVPFIQIREKDVSAHALAEFARAAIAAARPHGARILINDRVDVARATNADGVHLRVNSLSAAEVRTFVPTNFLIGVSTHSLAEAQAAQVGGADFITCGPVYETPAKLSYGAPLGLDSFQTIAQQISLPVYALGGITATNFVEPLQHGAAGIAAIRLFQQTEQLAALINNIFQAKRA